MELYAIGRSHRPSYIAFAAASFTVLSCIFFECVSSAPASFNRAISDECDWFGSGLEAIQRRNLGVQPVYLRCKEGYIEWQYPRLALRIVLRLGQSNKEFRGCLKVTNDSSGATVYLQGYQKLHYLYGRNEETEGNKQICFTSIGGQVALFLEAQGPYDSLKKNVIRILYDLEPIKLKSYSECRPCTERELVYHFCTSDFVVHGTITSLYQNEQLQQSEMTVRSIEIMRDTEPKVFTLSKISNNDTAYSGVLYRPLNCFTKAGSGEFLFLGRRRLGDPILMCAPRWAEWKKVRRKAIMAENLDCMLE